MPRHLPLVDLAARVAGLRALERFLFEQFGAWAIESDEAVLKPVLATWSHQHAWHVSLWTDRFPAIPGFDPDDPVADAPSVDTVDRSTPIRARIDAVFLALVPDLEARVRRLRDEVDPVLDPSTVRVCELVLSDLVAERQLAGSIIDNSGSGR